MFRPHIVAVIPDRTAADGVKTLLGEKLGVPVIYAEAEPRAMRRAIGNRDDAVAVLDARQNVQRIADVISALQQFGSRCRSLAIVDPELVAATRLLVLAGVHGIVAEDSLETDLPTAVSQLLQGQAFTSPRAVSTLFESLRRSAALFRKTTLSSRESLTDKEFKVVSGLLDGMSNAEIAQYMGASEPTVKAYLSQVMKKWGLRDRVQVALRAVQSGTLTSHG